MAIQAGTTQGGDLRFDPQRPQLGQRVEVSYRPASMLAGESRLQLRARRRTTESHSIYGDVMGS